MRRRTPYGIECRLCDRVFAREHDLENHCRAVHGVQPHRPHRRSMQSGNHVSTFSNGRISVATTTRSQSDIAAIQNQILPVLFNSCVNQKEALEVSKKELQKKDKALQRMDEEIQEKNQKLKRVKEMVMENFLDFYPEFG